METGEAGEVKEEKHIRIWLWNVLSKPKTSRIREAVLNNYPIIKKTKGINSDCAKKSRTCVHPLYWLGWVVSLISTSPLSLPSCHSSLLSVFSESALHCHSSCPQSCPQSPSLKDNNVLSVKLLVFHFSPSLHCMPCGQINLLKPHLLKPSLSRDPLMTSHCSLTNVKTPKRVI